ncbi:MAG: class I SAM-dependent methyltransferase [Acidobacteriota bacterium]
MSLREKWDAHASEWIAWARAPGHDSYWRFHRDAFLALVSPPGALTVDVGCGEGRLTRDLRARGHRTIGVEPSSAMLSAAREADPGGDYRQGAAEAIPLPDGEADLVVSFMVFQDVDDLEGAVKDCARILRPGGRLCAAIVHPINSSGLFENEDVDSPFVMRDSYLGERDYEESLGRAGLTMTFHSRHRPLESYARALEGAGFLIEKVREPPAIENREMSERSKRWLRIPLFLHVLAVKEGHAPRFAR